MLPATIKADALFYVLLLLVVVGALNWLLVGLFNWDLVAAITLARQPKADNKMAARVVYSLVGAAAIALVVVILARQQ
jgi:uncharacterized membrane protein YuzA (DUF378 family)